MDFWVFVAAASAGCLTKYLKSKPRDSKGCHATTMDGSWYIGKRMNRYGDASRSNVSDEKVLVTNPTAEVVSTLGSEETIARYLEGSNFLSIASVRTEYTENAADTVRENESTSGSDICSGSGDRETGNFEGMNCLLQCSGKSNLSLRSRYRHLPLRLLTSLESCLVAQLYYRHAEWEDRTRSSARPSASSMARPLLVTDRSNITIWRCDGFVGTQDATEASCIRKHPPTQIRRDGRSGISIGSVDAQSCNMSGSIQGTALFFLGVYVGIISSVARKKTDVDKLKDLLKQTENLVQDLQEELEMKDSVIVKEIDDDDMYGSRDTHQTSFPDANPTPSSNERWEGDVSEGLRKPGTGDNTDSMSKIEAELEAELERLGLNVGLCNVQLNNMVVEKDGSSSSSTAPSGNYAVSPRALTLRLHEVVRSRLEERIQELELALETSRRKVRLMESTHKCLLNRRFLNDVSRPVSMNLHKDEANEEFMKFDSSEENLLSCRDDSPASQSVKQNGTSEKIVVVKPLLLHGAEAANGTLSCKQDTDSLGISRDESRNADDEMLIRQLVERTKRRSPAMMKVLFAQVCQHSDHKAKFMACQGPI